MQKKHVLWKKIRGSENEQYIWIVFRDTPEGRDVAGVLDAEDKANACRDALLEYMAPAKYEIVRYAVQ